MRGLGEVEVPGFERIEHPCARILARPEALPWARYVLEGGETLHGAASRVRGAHPLEGRSTVFVIPAPGGRGTAGTPSARWAVRHYVRGGRLAPALLGDRYLMGGRIRPFHELQASEEARARGIPTPRVLAASLYPGRFFYRADLVTEFVPDSTELVEAVFDTRRTGVGGSIERKEALRAAGSLIRRMGETGIAHRDLHAGNILLQWKGSAPLPHLLDLDRCEVSPGRAPLSPEPMALRLRRSLRKWEGRTGLRISKGEWGALEEGVRG